MGVDEVMKQENRGKWTYVWMVFGGPLKALAAGRPCGGCTRRHLTLVHAVSYILVVGVNTSSMYLVCILSVGQPVVEYSVQ